VGIDVDEGARDAVAGLDDPHAGVERLVEAHDLDRHSEHDGIVHARTH
jgi:hypothetical protein